jgi:hypothetical protein
MGTNEQLTSCWDGDAQPYAGYARSRRGAWQRMNTHATWDGCYGELLTYVTVNGQPIVEREVCVRGKFPGKKKGKRRC